MIIFKKLGSLPLPPQALYQQYPTPLLSPVHSATGRKDLIKVMVTDRKENKSFPMLLTYQYDHMMTAFRPPFYLYGYQKLNFTPEVGRFDEGGIAIQDFICKQDHTGSLAIDALVTCYSPGDPNTARYKTLIKKSHFVRSRDENSYYEESPVYDPLIPIGGMEFSVCTPHRMPNTNVMYYNSHTDWAIRDTGNKEEWSPDYCIKARFIDGNTSRPGPEIVLPSTDEDGMECQTRPWTFEFKGTKYFLMSTRSPWRYKTDVEHSYKTRLFKFEDNSLKEVEFAWQGKSEFMEAYTTALVIDGRCFLFYNSNFNSPVMVAEMIVT